MDIATLLIWEQGKLETILFESMDLALAYVVSNLDHQPIESSVAQSLVWDSDHDEWIYFPCECHFEDYKMLLFSTKVNTEDTINWDV